MEGILVSKVVQNSRLVEARLGALEHNIATYGNELKKEVGQKKMKFEQAKDMGSAKNDASHGSSSMEI
ncbi:hypothetical protein Scep_024122 [Stephania cephalantha]|uniref:Uncharacterized protein n=1 Tax=Stephania cephalantha TaxID=152367 RepID=A0AAP0HWU8_9MAGN